MKTGVHAMMVVPGTMSVLNMMIVQDLQIIVVKNLDVMNFVTETKMKNVFI
jgi:hypothetical protein